MHLLQDIEMQLVAFPFIFDALSGVPVGAILPFVHELMEEVQDVCWNLRAVLACCNALGELHELMVCAPLERTEVLSEQSLTVTASHWTSCLVPSL